VRKKKRNSTGVLNETPIDPYRSDCVRRVGDSYVVAGMLRHQVLQSAKRLLRETVALS